MYNIKLLSESDLTECTSSTFSKCFQIPGCKSNPSFGEMHGDIPLSDVKTDPPYANDFMSHTDVACRVQTGRLLSTDEDRQML